MEFVLVAPLYFLLLGGLFLVADLVVNRIRMQIGDELVTWVAASRFCPQSDNGERDASKVADLLDPLFERSIGGAVIGFRVNTTNAARFNNFLDFCSGGISKLPVKVPEWVRGMMSMLGLMSGSSDSDWLNRSVVEVNCDFPRAYVFQRRALSGIDRDPDPDDAASRDRALSASDVVTRGYLEEVLMDDWIHLDDGKEEEAPSMRVQQDIPKRRYLGMFGE